MAWADDLTSSEREAIGVSGPVAAVLDPRGRTVRCTPRRRTVVRVLGDGAVLFRKVRCRGGAGRDWHLLQLLAGLGFRVPRPAYHARCRGASVVAFYAVPGRPLDALLREAATGAGGQDSQRAQTGIRGYLERVVAPEVARLHARGLVFRDLYWNHLFASSLEVGSALHFIDVERVFRPTWRRRRWIVKDLAGLLASAPPHLSTSLGLAFLRSYCGGALGGGWKRLALDVLRKADRIRAHTPRYG